MHRGPLWVRPPSQFQCRFRAGYPLGSNSPPATARMRECFALQCGCNKCSTADRVESPSWCPATFKARKTVVCLIYCTQIPEFEAIEQPPLSAFALRNESVFAPLSSLGTLCYSDFFETRLE